MSMILEYKNAGIFFAKKIATQGLPIFKNHSNDCIDNGKYKNTFSCIIAVAIDINRK